MAAEAGFSGERAVDTWRRRMKRLAELKFIATKKGAAGDSRWVLVALFFAWGGVPATQWQAIWKFIAGG